MPRVRYDTVREGNYSPYEIARISDVRQMADLPCHLSHLIDGGADPVRLAQVKDVIETVITGRKYEVLLLRSQGKSVSETALLLSISKTAVQSHYRRAIRQVRRALGLDGYASPAVVEVPSVSQSA